MQPLEEFVVMQRFFRLALSSRFSDKFPSYKLVALERETRGLVKKQTTLRWQAPDVEQSQRQLEQLKIVAPAEYDHVLQFMRAARDKSSGVCAPI
jgi:hypothetical protein